MQIQQWRPFSGWILSVSLLASPMVVASPAVAPADPVPVDEAVTRGEAVVREWLRRDQGFHDTQSSMQMILESRTGRGHERRLQVSTLEVTAADAGDKSLIVFAEPRDIRGTALLSFSHVFGSDEQWVYLPTLKRVKRIASNNKSGPFVGSEFAYEDLVSQDFERYEYRFLREEPCGEFECFVVEQRPRYENSGYTRQEAWYDKERYQPRRVDYFDRKGDFLKSLALEDYRLYLGRFWRAHELEMVNHQTGKRTLLSVESFEFQTGLTAADFSQSRMRQAR